MWGRRPPPRPRTWDCPRCPRRRAGRSGYPCGAWRGESAWIPLGDFDVGFETHTSYPAPGQILLYPGGYSETEILFPYGGTRFASIVGQLAGNHFLTITEGRENLRALGEMVLWEGAKDVVFERA